ncbi:MAG: hypothetical protein M3491_12165 [Actinomycetota bacterium]|jgi:hypothetical protein|nr:hypothetical protein [Rubrobacter sp.]MBA3616648.1 hypothetical protein [Rubrobacteraceae bacterium]MDQ3438059.1 hypothetical protein [Actinomycetota bacterium]
MASLRERLGRLEARAPAARLERIPVVISVLLTATERHRAVLRGEEPPPYSPEELEEMHREDLEVVAGGGVVGYLRESGGWDSPESAAVLDQWEEDARRRVEGGGDAHVT